MRDHRGTSGELQSVRPGTLTALLQEIAGAPESELGGAWEAVLRPGATVDRFELVRELGRGGFGVVWEAKDLDLGRVVAFKAVRAGARPDVREELLLREAEAAARLSHPNIVTLHDLGRAEQGPYLVFELLRGETLEKRLEQGSLPAREALRIGVEIARGVAHAHAQGVVHRDLKPANVFLCQDGQVKVLDFGLAHAFGRRRADGGTPAYMAPEQREGAPEDERTDVFALGVMLFRMLAGALPFSDGEKGEGRPAPELEVPDEPGLGPFIATMLERNPVRRPRAGNEVLSALSAFQLELQRAPATSQAPVRTRRRRPLRLGALLAACAAALGIVAATFAWRALAPGAGRAPGERMVTLAVLPFANLSGDSAQDYFGDGIAEELAGKLSGLRGLAVKARRSVTQHGDATRSAAEIGARLGVDYLLDGSVRRSAGRIRVSATLVKTADSFQVWSETIEAQLDDMFDVQERVATRIADALHLRLGPDEAHALRDWGTRNPAAYDEYLRGQVLVERHHTRDHLDSARTHFERALQIDPRFAPALAELAILEAEMYRDFDSSPDRLARADALIERALALDPGLVRALFASGKVRGVRYDYAGAVERFRNVVRIEPRNSVAWDYLCWALGYLTPPRVSEAEQACRKSIEIDPGLALAHYHLARVLIAQGRFPEAEQEIAQIREFFPTSYLVHAGGFWLAMATKRPQDALASLDLAEQLKQTGMGRAWAAMALALSGRLDEAFAALDQAVAGGYRDASDLRGNPYFEPLRRDPRFATLLARLEIGR